MHSVVVRYVYFGHIIYTHTVLYTHTQKKKNDLNAFPNNIDFLYAFLYAHCAAQTRLQVLYTIYNTYTYNGKENKRMHKFIYIFDSKSEQTESLARRYHKNSVSDNGNLYFKINKMMDALCPLKTYPPHIR